MEHCAIDLGGRESQICVRSREGQIINEERWPTEHLGGYLKSRPQSRVIVETCAEAFHVADEALALGHEVRVVPAMLARTLGVGARRIKTDQRDARTLSEVSSRIDLPSVHIPSQRARDLKSMCNMREGLIEVRTKLVNTVRGFLRTRRLRLRGGALESFPTRVRQKLITEPTGIPAYVERILQALDTLNIQIKEADKELTKIAKADETCRRLMSVPGVGPVSAVRFLSALDDVSRFSGAHEVESYLGLTPGENSSSDKKRITSITKAGSRKVRWVLVQAAWSAWRTRPNDPMVVWAKQVAERRGRRIAIIALVRKIAGILYAIWRDGATYKPEKAALASQQQEKE
jgi:transposase